MCDLISFLRIELTMRFITESSLFILLLCCCCYFTVNARCWVECPVSQRGLSEPECFLKDDGTSTSCSKNIRNSDLTSQSITKYKYVSISIDLSPKVKSLYIYNRIGSKLKVGVFRAHPNVTNIEIRHNGTTCIHPSPLVLFVPQSQTFTFILCQTPIFPSLFSFESSSNILVFKFCFLRNSR